MKTFSWAVLISNFLFIVSLVWGFPIRGASSRTALPPLEVVGIIDNQAGKKDI